MRDSSVDILMVLLILSLVLSLVASVSTKGHESMFVWSQNNDKLNSIPFSLSSCDNTLGPFTGNVPGDVHSDLMAANVITPNPYFRFEEKNLSWITSTCWKYVSSPFHLDSHYDDDDNNDMDSSPLLLSFDNINGPANVYLNDQLIGTAVNAHRKHTFVIDKSIIIFKSKTKWTNSLIDDLNHLLRRENIPSDESIPRKEEETDKGNILKIELLSSLAYTKQQADSYPYSVPATENYNVWAEPTSRNFLRKAGSDFG